MVKFQIKKVQLRSIENLMQYINNIRTGVHVALSSSIWIINVYPTYFEIPSFSTLSPKKAQQVGKEIMARCSHFQYIATTYNYSRSNGDSARSVQLFEQF